MANEVGEKELKRDWPHEEGLTLGTTKIEGKEWSLKPEDTLVPSRYKVLL